MAKKYILLVEDNQYDELLTRRAFSKNNLADQLEVVRDGAEALDFLLGPAGGPPRDPARQPALVLLDFRLPRLNGAEVLERLRAEERTRHLPVVMLTASDDDQDLERTGALGIVGYVRKPVNFQEFVRQIRDLSDTWLREGETVPPPGGAPP